MNVLPDTSVWVEFLRRGRQGAAWHLDGLLATGSVSTCGPVVAELLAGAQMQDRTDLRILMLSLPWLPIGSDEWLLVGETAALLRDRGSSVPLTDLEIAVSAVSADTHVWTNDGDFDRIAVVLQQLRLYRP